MSDALDAINDAIDPKRVLRQIMRVPEPPPDLVRRVVEKYERRMGRKNRILKAHTNPQGETFFYGTFGSTKRNNVVVTLLYYDRGAGGWRELNMAEAIDPKRMLRQMNKTWKQTHHNTEFLAREGWKIEVWGFQRAELSVILEKHIEDPVANPDRFFWRVLLKKQDWPRWKAITLSNAMGEATYNLGFEQARARALKWADEGIHAPPKPFGEAEEPEKPQEPAKPAPRRVPDPKRILRQVRPAVPDKVREILEYMPPEFVQAYHAKEHAEWKNPYSDSDWWPSYDDDDAEEGEDGERPNPWREYRYEFEYYTDDGKLFSDVVSFDKDGDGNYDDHAEVGTPDYERLEKEYGSGGWVQAMIRYWEWVIAEGGYDPLNYVTIDRVPVKEKWVVGFVEEGERLKVWGLRNTSNPPSPPAVKWPRLKAKAESDPNWKKALEYCLVDDNGYTSLTLENLTNDGSKWKTIGGQRVLSLGFEWTDQEAVGNEQERILEVARDALAEMQRLADRPRPAEDNEGD